jgi:hypothetical protein
MRRRISQIFPAVFVLVFFSPPYALAEWVTWHQFGTEGSYVHQIAHLLFGLSMLFFIYEIFHANLQKFRGFQLLVWSWGILALWNLDAFIGHWADWTLENPIILGQGWGRQLLMYDFQTWLVYITKVDHFVLLVPAFLMFYLGLKALVRKPGAE